MARYQRMVVIPQSEYLQLTALQEVKHPVAQQFFNAEQKYEDAAAIPDPYARLAARSENLDQMKALKEEMRNYVSLATPKPYRSRAERLLSVLEPYVKWNERGEIIDIKTNRPVERSQLSDLIQHAVRDRRRKISPTGWQYFLNQLHERNVPQMLLNLPTLDELKKVQSLPSSIAKSPELQPAPNRSRAKSIERTPRKSRSPTRRPRQSTSASNLRERSRRRITRSKLLDDSQFLSDF